MNDKRNIVVVATPSSPLLHHLLHQLSHQPSFQIKVLTRETSVSITRPDDSHHSHNHDHALENQLIHLTTDFTSTSLLTHLSNTHAVITHLTGSDIHHTSSLITASIESGVKSFIPSEYGLDTSNAHIRSLLPPYETRFGIQKELERSGMHWTAIYSGLVLDEAMKTEGALGVDCLWGSVVKFSKNQTVVAISTYEEIAKAIVSTVLVRDEKWENEIWTCTFRATLTEIVSAVEKKLEKTFDVYEGSLEDAKREARERMKGGYFHGGVALMGRVAAWDDSVDTWGKWDGKKSAAQAGWEEEVGRVALRVRNGEGMGGGCGC